MIATLLSENIQKLLTDLARLNDHWEIAKLPVKNTREIYQTLGSGVYTLLIIDIMGFNKNVSAALEIIERLGKSSTLELIVISQAFDKTSPTCLNIISFGISEDHLLTGNDTLLKKQLQDLLPSKVDATQEQYEEDNQSQPLEDIEEEPLLPHPIARTVIPPSTVTITEAKKNLIHKPPVLAQSATMISFAGAGRRIGVTTQAMQTVLYLKNQDRKVALIEYHDRAALGMYLQIISDKHLTLFDDDHFRLYGTDIYLNPNNILKIKSQYDYLVIDYGAFVEIKDTSSYLDKDIVVAVGGVKPFESNQLSEAFSADDGSIKYIFSFVPHAAKSEVIELMDESGNNTYFASYSPDYFNYCGDDEMYGAITGVTRTSNAPTQNKLSGIFKKGR
ncbi:MAG: hypothetical protein FWG21_03695 [Oscillospiraceae bacterium]|nr:hypothetical protein [Oscillospiraceae bacterium]